jgi:sarcosine oxidase subunit alpha
MPRLPDPRFAPDCTISFDGRPIPARAGESVAVALLAAGRGVITRSSKYHRPRGAFCLAGSCHGCLARVDGLPHQRTCRVACRPGLWVESQNGVPTARRDLLSVIDVVYPHGLDHHHLATWNGVANRAAVALARRLAGLAPLASAVPEPWPPASEERVEALVVGAGPAGLGAAEALAAGGRQVLLAEADRTLGGRLACGLQGPGDPPLAWAGQVGAAVAAAGGEVATGAAAVGVWHDGGLCVALRIEARAEGSAPEPCDRLRAGGVEGPAPRLRLIRPARLILATGTTALPPLWPGNDLPGIFAARGLARALAQDGLVPGRRAVVLGAGHEAEALRARLAQAGVEVAAAAELTAAAGGSRLRSVQTSGGERLRCDTLACAEPGAPASDLARQAGASVALDRESGGFHVEADAAGATRCPGLWAAGEVVRPMSAAEAALAGRRAGEAAHGD